MSICRADGAAAKAAQLEGVRCHPASCVQPASYIGERLRAKEACEWDRETRVRVWTPGGTQIGIPGVGEGENRLTFPRDFEVGVALSCQTWIRFATPDERRAHNNRWWMEYEGPVCELIYATGEIAPHNEPIGLVIRDGPRAP